MIWFMLSLLVLSYFLITVTIVDLFEQSLFFEMPAGSKFVLVLLWIPLFIARGAVILYQSICEMFQK